MFKKLTLLTLALSFTAPTFAQDAKQDCQGVRSLICSKPNLGKVMVSETTAAGGIALVGAGRQEIKDIKKAQALDQLEDYFSASRRLVPDQAGDTIKAAEEFLRHARQSDTIIFWVKNNATREYFPVMTDSESEAREILQVFKRSKNIKVHVGTLTRNTARDVRLLRSAGRAVKLGSALVIVGTASLGLEMAKAWNEDKVREQETKIQVQSYQQAKSAAQ